jgi:riboflavin kinase / FMN adenylyltransferase
VILVQSTFHSLSELPSEQHVVTIGSFDGVHRGHAHLLNRVIQEAEQRGVPSLAITFDPLPAEVLRPDKAPARLCSTDTRTAEMLRCGIDRVVVLEFNQQMAAQSADDFLRELVQASSPVAIVVGEDFAFGHKRQGTPEFLSQQASIYGYQVNVVERINPVENVRWSSSFARSALTETGDVRTAEQVLGRPFRVNGIVQNGDHRGRELGYPTANLHPSPGLVLPSDGIYAALATLDAIEATADLPALVYIGTRPTFGESNRVIEVFLLDFNEDLYGRSLSADFVDRVRGDRAFDSAEELVSQMKVDEREGRRMLAERIGEHVL